MTINDEMRKSYWDHLAETALLRVAAKRRKLLVANWANTMRCVEAVHEALDAQGSARFRADLDRIAAQRFQEVGLAGDGLKDAEKAVKYLLSRSDGLRVISRVDDLPEILRDDFVELSVSRLKAVIESESTIFAASTIAKRFATIARAFGLNEIEHEVLRIYALFTSDARLITENDDGCRWPLQKNNLVRILEMLTHQDTARITLINARLKLTRMGLLVREFRGRVELTLNDEFYETVASEDPNEDFVTTMYKIVEPDQGAPVPINVSPNDVSLITKLLKSAGGASIIFYGEAGTGKTSLAQAVCGKIGARILTVPCPESGDQSARIANILAAIRVAQCRTEPTVVLIDEADQILNTLHSYRIDGTKSLKGAVNDTLDSKEVKTIWITNAYERIESSTMRRFSYGLHFKPYNNKQRQELWRSALAKAPSLRADLGEDGIQRLSESYGLSAAHIADSVRQVALMDVAGPERTAALERILVSYHERLHGKKQLNASGLVHSGQHVASRGLNADINLDTVLETARHFFEHITNEVPGKSTLVRNLNMLFSGHPGTGKSEFARSLSQHIGRDVIIKTASTLKSCWVGETERKIAAAFEEAEGSGSILIIDEADTFLYSRSTASRSWETSEVNEFLCQMERFKGMLICTTNYMENFDDAALRRFAIKVRFDWLKNGGKSFFFHSIFAPLFTESVSMDLTPSQETRLSAIECLAPGDFKVVFQNRAFLPPGSTGVDDLIAGLETEASYKGKNQSRQVGFCRPD